MTIRRLRPLLPTKGKDQLYQTGRQDDVTERHRDLKRDVPLQPCKLVEAIDEVQQQQSDSEQFDTTTDETVAQVSEQNDRGLIARYMCPGRYNQGADHHLFDVTEYFL